MRHYDPLRSRVEGLIGEPTIYRSGGPQKWSLACLCPVFRGGETRFRWSVNLSFGVVGLNFSSSLIVAAYRHEESNNVTKDDGWEAQSMVWLDTVSPALE